MPAELTIEVNGFEELAARVSDPALMEKPMRNLFEAATRLGQKTAIQGIDGGTGVAVRSILREYSPAMGRVWSMMPLARSTSIEGGRPSGDNTVSTRAIARWADAVKNPERPFVLARAIRERGVKGRFFMRSAGDAVQGILPALIQKANDAIIKKMAGK